MHKEIQTYNNTQPNKSRVICNKLAEEIQASLDDAENKIWHGSPVWFLAGNPIVGYDVLKDCVRLLFWSGQSFNEQDLQPEGSFKAAEMRYSNIDQINIRELKRWLEKSKTIQWDYKDIVKRLGVLERLK